MQSDPENGLDGASIGEVGGQPWTRLFLSLLCSLSILPAWAGDSAPRPAPDNPAAPNPWAFNLTLYTWLPGIDGKFSAGPVSASVDKSFFGVADKSHRFPLGFMGRVEAHYERFGFYLDGNYMNLDLKPKFDRISEGLETTLGLMDYGVAYRVLGPAAGEVAAALEQKRNANALEVYAGGRTLWLENTIDLRTPFGNPLNGPRSFSSSKSFTSPVIGARFGVNFNPRWFVLVDGNVGGFGAQNVNFTGSLMGVVGYRTTLFDVPTSIEAGYKALRYNVESGSIKTNATLNGPFVGLTGYW